MPAPMNFYPPNDHIQGCCEKCVYDRGEHRKDCPLFVAESGETKPTVSSPAPSSSLCGDVGPGGCKCELSAGHVGNHMSSERKTFGLPTAWFTMKGAMLR